VKDTLRDNMLSEEEDTSKRNKLMGWYMFNDSIVTELTVDHMKYKKFNVKLWNLKLL
jgi:hypothetical protein